VEHFQLIGPDLDVEIRPQVPTLATKVTNPSLGTHRFQCFSSWKSLVRAVATLTHVAKSFSQSTDTQTCKKWHTCMKPGTTERSQAKATIIKAGQRQASKDEFKSLTTQKCHKTARETRSLHPQRGTDEWAVAYKQLIFLTKKSIL